MVDDDESNERRRFGEAVTVLAMSAAWLVLWFLVAFSLTELFDLGRGPYGD